MAARWVRRDDAYIAGGYSFSSGLTMGELYKFVPPRTPGRRWPMSPAAIMALAVYYPTTNKLYVFGGEDAVSGQLQHDPYL